MTIGNQDGISVGSSSSSIVADPLATNNNNNTNVETPKQEGCVQLILFICGPLASKV